jgi:TPR repeat protein
MATNVKLRASDLNYPPAESGLGLLIQQARVPAADDPIALFKRAAQHRDPRGSYCFALALASGEGVRKNEWKAAKHFLTVANFDERKRDSIGAESYLDEFREMVRDSQYRYALFRQRGIGPGTGAPLKDAVKYFRLAAEKNHLEAQFQLALHLEQGIGEDRDLPAAMRLYEGPAAAGNPRAQNRRAFLIETVNRDLEGAFVLYSQAAAAGHTHAGFNRARLLQGRGDTEGAAALFRLAADDGHAPSAFRLALLLEHGATRVPQDIRGAVRYYGQAAAAGIAPASFNLARLYTGRYGAPANLEESFRLYKEAADKRHPKALFRPAVLYEGGIGVAASLELAYQYYERAAELTDPDGRFQTVILEAKFRTAMSKWKGFGTNVDAGQAMFLFRKLAEAGHVHASLRSRCSMTRRAGTSRRRLRIADLPLTTAITWATTCTDGNWLMGSHLSRGTSVGHWSF